MISDLWKECDQLKGMDSSQSRLLDTQYILEYEPSPTLIGEYTFALSLHTTAGL